MLSRKHRAYASQHKYTTLRPVIRYSSIGPFSCFPGNGKRHRALHPSRKFTAGKQAQCGSPGDAGAYAFLPFAYRLKIKGRPILTSSVPSNDLLLLPVADLTNFTARSCISSFSSSVSPEAAICASVGTPKLTRISRVSTV
jgi:hypothetical protein